MTDATARLMLPMIVPGQAQKEMTHNEALARLDIAVQAVATAIGVDAPPADPAIGECWVVGSAPVGAWAGHANALAGWTAGGWRFMAPTPGFRLWDMSGGHDVRFIDGEWAMGAVTGARLVIGGAEMLASPAAAIADPVGGATVDVAARDAIAAILAALRHHNLMAAD